MSGRLIIVGGAPATGKTTLAEALATSLELPVITKDDVKEALAERIVRGGQGVILESNFRRGQSEAPLAALARLAPAVVIVCRTRNDLRRERFAQRAAGGRHRVHIDGALLEEWSDEDAEFLIDIGVVRLVVDTTERYVPAFDAILSFARTATVVTRDT